MSFTPARPPLTISPEDILSLSEAGFPSLSSDEIERLLWMLGRVSPLSTVKQLYDRRRMTDDQLRCITVYNACRGDACFPDAYLLDGRTRQILIAFRQAMEGYSTVPARPDLVRERGVIAPYASRVRHATTLVMTHLMHRRDVRTDIGYRLPSAMIDRFPKSLVDEFNGRELFATYLKICATAFSIEFCHPIPTIWVADNIISQSLAHWHQHPEEQLHDGRALSVSR